MSSLFGRFITDLLCMDGTNFVTVDRIFEEEDIRHSIKDFRERNKKGGTEEWGGKLLDINQHETKGQSRSYHHQLPESPRTQNGLIMILCGWWYCFVAPYDSVQCHPKHKANTWITFGCLLWSHVVRRTHLSLSWLHGFERSSATLARILSQAKNVHVKDMDLKYVYGSLLSTLGPHLHN